MISVVDAMLAEPRGFAVAAAGCGKTELLGRIVADERSGRQLVLTHTHAGVAAIKKRLVELRVPAAKYNLDTIAGWCLRYGAAYSEISGVRADAEADPDWEAAYPGAERVLRTPLGGRVVGQSYNGVLVDEYQDCSQKQHAVVQALSARLACRAVGDPLQAIFDFRDDPCVTWDAICSDFKVLENVLLQPWRWHGRDRNAALGKWLVEARHQLESCGRLEIDANAPVTWVRHDGEPTEAWAAVCREMGAPGESSIAILKWPNQCIELAKRLGGRWPIVERFDDPDLLRLGKMLAESEARALVGLLLEFIAARTTQVGTDLRAIADAIGEGRSTARFTKHRDHLDRLNAFADGPTPTTALAAIDGILANREWWLYRRECVYQLRAALRESLHGNLTDLPDAIAAARTRARHRGRQTHRRTIGTPLLVKGLEFDHAALFWEPQHLTAKGLYVAITRASKSLTIVSSSRTLVPESR
jgi:superfamily I DNA/RNA helicase